MSAPTVRVVPLQILQRDAHNARAHNARNLDLLASSLRQHGAARSGVIDEGDRILAGNGLHEAAVAEGYSEAVIVEVDGTRPVFVKRSGLTDAQKTTLAIADNRVGETSTWHTDVLDALAAAAPDVRSGWTDAEWAALHAQADAAGAEAPRTVRELTPENAPTPTTNQYAVIVPCADEATQEQVYTRLVALGYTARVVNT